MNTAHLTGTIGEVATQYENGCGEILRCNLYLRDGAVKLKVSNAPEEVKNRTFRGGNYISILGTVCFDEHGAMYIDVQTATVEWEQRRAERIAARGGLKLVL